MTVSTFTQEMIHKIDSNESTAYTIVFTLDSYGNRSSVSHETFDCEKVKGLAMRRIRSVNWIKSAIQSLASLPDVAKFIAENDHVSVLYLMIAKAYDEVMNEQLNQQ